MKAFCRLVAVGAVFIAGAASAQTLAPSPTLDAVKARGHIECGVHLGLPGFSFANDKGEWSGLDVDYCRSLAAAVLGDATKVKFTPTSVQQRWAVLQSGQVDLLARNTTITFSRNATLGVDFQGINFYEGQTFVVRTKAKVNAVKDLADATVCVAAGSTEEKTAADYFRERGLKITIINFQKNDDAISAYDQGRCDAYTAGIGALAGQRIKFKDPAEHQILTEIISNDPQGPVTRWGDERWQLIVRWVLNAQIAAEAFGITSKNVDEMKAKSTNAEVRRILGVHHLGHTEAINDRHRDLIAAFLAIRERGAGEIQRNLGGQGFVGHERFLGATRCCHQQRANCQQTSKMFAVHD